MPTWPLGSRGTVSAFVAQKCSAERVINGISEGSNVLMLYLCRSALLLCALHVLR